MVVIESSSMSHGAGNPPPSQLGAIDTGDIVLVKESGREDITTYVEGKHEGYKSYGQYGDVIIYRPDGNQQRTPIIHRPVLYLQYDKGNHSFDIPELANLEYGEGEDWTTSMGNQTQNLVGQVTIYDYGYSSVNITIQLNPLLRDEHSGFITMGDNNFREDSNVGIYDQGNIGQVEEAVKTEWVEGKARGELPWFGIIKLSYMGKTDNIAQNSWVNFIVSLIAITLIPFAIDTIYERFYKKEEDEVDLDKSDGVEKETLEPDDESTQDELTEGEELTKEEKKADEDEENYF